MSFLSRLGKAVKDFATLHPIRAIRDITQPEPERERGRGAPPKEPPRQPPQPPGDFFPPPQEPEETPGQIPLSDRVYHVIIAGRGPVWFRPTVQDENDAKDYVINMQGYLRDGSRKHNRAWFERRIEQLRDARISGELTNGVEIFDEEFETDLGSISYYASHETMTGEGWRSE